MGPGTIFRTSLVLAREKIYQGRKEKTGSSREGRVTNRTLWIANLAVLPIYFLISIFLAGSQIAMGSALGAFSLLVLVQFFLSFLVTLTSVSTFRDLDLHQPVVSLPIRREYLVVSLSWLLSGGVAILIIPLPAAAIYTWATGSILPIPVSFLWGALTVLFGHSLGLALTNVFSFSASERSALGKAFRSFKIIGALLLFLLWFFISTHRGVLKPLLEPLTGVSKSLWFLYPFNASGSIVNFSGVHLLSFVLYGLLFTGLYWVAGKRTWSNIVEPSFAIGKRVEGFEIKIGGKLRSLIRKDLTLSFRSGQRFLGILAFPLMILFMGLINVVQGGEVPLLGPEMVYLAVAVMSGMGIIYLYIQEGESAWIMSSLPISKGEFAFQKALSTFSLFPFYAVPAILLVSVREGFGFSITLLQLVSGLAAALTSCLIVSNSLADRLPDNPTVITQESFGSRFAPILIILKSAVLTGWPVLASAALYFPIAGSLAGMVESVTLLALIALLVLLNLALTVWRYGWERSSAFEER